VIERLAELQSTLERLLAERDQVCEQRDQFREERDQYRELYLKMMEQCRKLERGLVGPKSERLPENEAQLTMSMLATLLGERSAEPAAPPQQTIAEHSRS